jgi:hypothetical protein
VNWIKNAWIKIQTKHANWRWMRHQFYHTTASGTSTIIIANNNVYDGDVGGAISRFARCWPDIYNLPAIRILLLSADVGTERWLNVLPWEDFVDLYMKGKTPSTNIEYPQHISVSPRNHLHLGPTPDDAYYVRGYFQLSPQVLAADSDEPEMPEHFHELIVWEAMRRYARFVAAPEVWADAKNEAASLMRALEVDQLPEPKFAPPLA